MEVRSERAEERKRLNALLPTAAVLDLLNTPSPSLHLVRLRTLFAPADITGALQGVSMRALVRALDGLNQSYPGERNWSTETTFGALSREERRRFLKALLREAQRSQRRESKAERAARQHFNEVVKARPCFFRGRRDCARCEGKGIVAPLNSLVRFSPCPDCRGGGHHRCDGPKDAHHLIPKQFIRQRLSDWPEDKLLAVLFNPLIGAPLCRGAHDAIERGSERIYWEDLTEEALEYVSGLPDFMLLRLEGECPKREQGAAA